MKRLARSASPARSIARTSPTARWPRLLELAVALDAGVLETLAGFENGGPILLARPLRPLDGRIAHGDGLLVPKPVIHAFLFLAGAASQRQRSNRCHAIAEQFQLLRHFSKVGFSQLFGRQGVD